MNLVTYISVMRRDALHSDYSTTWVGRRPVMWRDALHSDYSTT